MFQSFDGVGVALGRFIGLQGHIRDIGEGYAVIVTAILVIFGWYIIDRQNRSAHRRENAHKYIIDKNDELKNAVARLVENLVSRTPFPKFSLGSDEKIADLKSLLIKLEIISVDIRYGLVSESYIMDTQSSLIINIFELSKEFISSTREGRKQPSAYKNLECLYIRLKYRKFSVFQRIIEGVLGKPSFRFTMFMFKLKYLIYSFIKGLNRDHLLEKNEMVYQAVNMFNFISYCSYGVIFCLIFLKYFIF